MSRAQFVCPECQDTILAPASLEGRSFPCPKCRAEVDAWPAPARSATPPPLPVNREPVPSPYDPRREHAVAVWVSLSVVFLVLICIPIGLLLRQSKSTSAASSSAPTQAAPGTTPNRAVLTPPKDERPGRIVVRGLVKLVSIPPEDFLGLKSEVSGEVYLILQSGEEEVTCTFPPGRASYFDLEKFGGKMVTVRGRLTSRIHHLVMIDDCEIVR